MQPLQLLRGCVFHRLLITAFFLSFTCYASNAQANGRKGDLFVTIKGANISLKQVFNTIREQTGHSVMYSVSETHLSSNEKVSVDFNKAPLADVMAHLLRGKNLTWYLAKETIIIIRKEDAPKKNIAKPDNGQDTSSAFFSITGKVTDADGAPIPGATILVKGTDQGVTADAEGNFTLPNVTNGLALQVSSVGYETRELPVKGRTILVPLNILVRSLDETIIIAYGTTTKRYSTGNVSTVKAKDIEKQPVNNPLLALQGRVPGLLITQSTGLPGSGVTVRIQGQNSISKGNDPLYVVDGVPYISQLLPTLSNTLGGSGGAILNGVGSGSGNPLSFINPADILSIDVLKDADATAIYGSRAANGAILITTKKGKAGQTKVDVNMQTGWGQVTRRLDLLNTQQYLQMRREALKNDGITSPAPTDYDINGFWDTTRYTDWAKELIGGISHYTDVQTSISGGSENTQFLVGAGYHRETTVFQGDFVNRKGSLHFNLNHISSNRKFKLQLSGNYMVDNNRLPQVDITQIAMQLAPNAPKVYNEDGSLNWMQDNTGTSTWDNPLANNYNTYQIKTRNLISNVVLSYQILPGLDIRSSFGYTDLQSNEEVVNPLVAWAPELRPFIPRVGAFMDNDISSWIIEPQVSYSKSFGKGKLEALIGATIQQNNSNGQQLTGIGYNSDHVIADIRSASTVVVGGTIASTYKYNALFGRLNYKWKDRYIVDFTARKDGSSRFGSQNQFHNFGAVGLGWIFSSESFIRDNLKFISFGKLRGSYGTTGNDQIGDYQFLSQYVPTNAGVPYQGATGLIPNGLTNPYLAWEETKKLQFGLDLGLFNDRILINTNYFRNRSSNQLLAYKLPVTTGFNSIERNFPATVENSGWELSLNTVNFKLANFNWTSNVNLTVPKNKLIDFPDLSSSSYANLLVVGQPITLRKVFDFIGVNPTTGTYQFADSHGNATSTPDNLIDRTVFVNTSPVLYGGFQNNIRYKAFELDVLFQFVKQKGLNYSFGNRPGRVKLNQPEFILDRWKNQGDIASIQQYSAKYPPEVNVPFGAAANNSDAAFSDASYIRLKNFSLSWQLPAAWKQKIRLQGCKLYVQAQNLLTITNYKGLDPETLSTGTLPPLKVFTMGLRATL